MTKPKVPSWKGQRRVPNKAPVTENELTERAPSGRAFFLPPIKDSPSTPLDGDGHYDSVLGSGRAGARRFLEIQTNASCGD